ncbi:MAG: O-antigen ligase family protein [Flavobacterium sp.]|nr:O-antigen ligase family protein [Flavobacterium sp.]
MNTTDNRYFFLILLHVLIGLGLYYLPFFPKLYGYGIFVVGVYFVLNSRNRNNEVLYAAAYIVGSEVALRMTDGNPIYEYSKYAVIIFMLIGIYFSGISKNAVPIWLYLLFLIPGLVIGYYTLDGIDSVKNAISFNISGPLCLGLCALYCYTRRITFKQLNELLLLVGLPIISCSIYLYLYTPELKDILLGTGSNFATSGGFGPNQVATILGLGMFVFFSRLIFFSPNVFLFVINAVVAVELSYRGLITFSRGGIVTSLLMLIVLVLVTYVKISSNARIKMNYILVALVIGMAGTWVFSSSQTNGLINKRYANQDINGRVKEDRFTVREELAKDEIAAFLAQPIFGLGVGKIAEERQKKTGDLVVTHNEITRTIGEHGAFGILALLILFTMPLFIFFRNSYNIYILSFLVFWLLTINHAAMRLAAPAFIYALALLNVYVPPSKEALDSV